MGMHRREVHFSPWRSESGCLFFKPFLPSVFAYTYVEGMDMIRGNSGRDKGGQKLVYLYIF
jgi:hypothetical protein